jgi:hypothetical protein
VPQRRPESDLNPNGFAADKSGLSRDARGVAMTTIDPTTTDTYRKIAARLTIFRPQIDLSKFLRPRAGCAPL